MFKLRMFQTSILRPSVSSFPGPDARPNPKEAKPHIVELKFNGENVPGSPFKCLVLDAAKVNLSGEGLEKVSVGKQTSFVISGQGDMGDPEVKILSPLREVVTSSIRCEQEGQYEAQRDLKLKDPHKTCSIPDQTRE